MPTRRVGTALSTIFVGSMLTVGSEFTPILLLVALLALFYLVVLRPARRQQQATATVQRNLEVGDDVVLSSGIYGTITGLDDARVRLQVAPGTVIEVARQVVVRAVEDEPPAAPGSFEASEVPGAEPGDDEQHRVEKKD